MAKSPTAIAFDAGIDDDSKTLNLRHLKQEMNGQEPDWDEVTALLLNWSQGWSNDNKAYEVDLSDNDLGGTAADLFAIIIGLVQNINLSSNYIDNSCVARIAQSLEAVVAQNMKTDGDAVNLSDNMIGNKGMSLLLDSIKAYNGKNDVWEFAHFALESNMFNDEAIGYDWEDVGHYMRDTWYSDDANDERSGDAVEAVLGTQKKFMPASEAALEPELSGMLNEIKLLGIVANFEAAIMKTDHFSDQ